MGKSLDALDSHFESLAESLLSECLAAGIPVAIVCTDRDLADERMELAEGRSWLSNPEHSMHLPQSPEGKSKAIDVAPIAYLDMPLWNPTGPLWDEIGKIGNSLGLIWGGDWIHVNGGRGDPSHFQAAPMILTDEELAT
jgi:hypothetical protein